MKLSDWIHLVFLLDRSYSMTRRRRAMVDGYNQLLDDQKDWTANIVTTEVHAFDDGLQTVYSIQSIDSDRAKLSVISPGGGTALRDAINRLSVHRFPKIFEGDRKIFNGHTPKTVIFIVFTDGEDGRCTLPHEDFLNNMTMLKENGVHTILFCPDSNDLAVHSDNFRTYSYAGRKYTSCPHKYNFEYVYDVDFYDPDAMKKALAQASEKITEIRGMG